MESVPKKYPQKFCYLSNSFIKPSSNKRNLTLVPVISILTQNNFSTCTYTDFLVIILLNFIQFRHKMNFRICFMLYYYTVTITIWKIQIDPFTREILYITTFLHRKKNLILPKKHFFINYNDIKSNIQHIVRCNSTSIHASRSNLLTFRRRSSSTESKFQVNMKTSILFHVSSFP